MRTWPVSTYSSISCGSDSRAKDAQNGHRRSIHSVMTTGASTSPMALGSSASRRTSSMSPPACWLESESEASGVVVGDCPGSIWATTTIPRKAMTATRTPFQILDLRYFASSVCRETGEFTGVALLSGVGNANSTMAHSRLSRIVDPWHDRPHGATHCCGRTRGHRAHLATVGGPGGRGAADPDGAAMGGRGGGVDRLRRHIGPGHGAHPQFVLHPRHPAGLVELPGVDPHLGVLRDPVRHLRARRSG